MTVATDYTLKVKIFEPEDPRLGRHVRHDSRSLRYKAEESSLDSLVSKRYISNIPVLDQGDIGSCTGNAATKSISYNVAWATAGHLVLSTNDSAANETYAVGVYSDATKLDPWDGVYLPDDTGSDGLSVAKVLQSRGLISGYRHATSLNAVLTALNNAPVITGTSWRADMFNPDADGRVRITGAVKGGHEYVLDEIDVERRRVWIQNSWGYSWGIGGRGYLTFDDYEKLLLDDGDATIFVPNTEPAPTPTPGPAVTDADAKFAKAARKWLNGFPFFYKNLQKSMQDWLSAKNL